MSHWMMMTLIKSNTVYFSFCELITKDIFFVGLSEFLYLE